MAYEEAANRYAQAVFLIALQNGAVEQWRSYLGEIASVLTDSDVAAVFADDRRPLHERYALVDRVLDLPAVARNLAKLLIQKGRSRGAGAVAEAFAALADAYAGLAKAQITTAVPINDAQRAAIEQRLSASLGKTVTASTAVDPTLIGGLVVRVGDQLIDGSVRTRLRSLRRELTA
jgi:F-type H+-transporting ATPase subunit delta